MLGFETMLCRVSSATWHLYSWAAFVSMMVACSSKDSPTETDDVGTSAGGSAAGGGTEAGGSAGGNGLPGDAAGSTGSFLRAQGTTIVDGQGRPVFLRGVSFGNEVWANDRGARRSRARSTSAGWPTWARTPRDSCSTT